MNEKNLGVCFAPSLFHLCGTKEDPSSPKRQKRTPMNKASKELTDNLVSISPSPHYIPDPSFKVTFKAYQSADVLEQQTLKSATKLELQVSNNDIT